MTQPPSNMFTHPALQEFYKTRGIEEDNPEAKIRALRSVVNIPSFPYEPVLYDLEYQYLVDNRIIQP